MAYRKRSFTEKLADDKDLPKVERLSGSMLRRWGAGTMVLASAGEIDRLMRKVRRGRVTTVNQIRSVLAEWHGTTTACPIVTGIHAWVAACAAGEQEAEGRTRVTPYWRTLKEGGELNPKYPGGVARQRRRLQAEGHTIVSRGKRQFVADHERRLARLR